MTRRVGAPPRGDRTVAEGELLWSPDPARIADANLTAFTGWLREARGLDFAGYDALWRWSVDDLDAFWQAIWDYFDISASAPPAAVLGAREMPGAQWFPGARLNYAEHALRRAPPGAVALVHCDETSPLQELTTDDLAAQVRIVATRLRDMGVRPGDRVAAYLPNIPEAVVAMLATTGIGAVWAACSPDFGWRGALDRFGQLAPVVLFTVEGYRYGGRWFDRTADVGRIVGALDTLRRVIVVDRGSDGGAITTGGAVRWSAVLDHQPVPAETFAFTQVPFDHPLWILFSSGTTGLPKAIVHGHGGILIEQLKLQHFHLDLGPGDRLFFFTTTGWMMWNFVASALVLGVCPVLYDGNPTYPDAGALWRIVQDARAAVFGASPAYVDLLSNAGVVPGRQYDLSSLRTVMPAGSPVSPVHTAWFYDNVAADLWVATGSGGTDVCTGFVGGVPTLPVYAGEIQARSLGVAAHAFNERGEPVVDEVGELVITAPMPSMPVRLWGDNDGARYRETYFSHFSGVWRHGDFFRVNRRGGCFVLGRSDATLNRHGVRIGTAEIYRALDQIDEITDALVVNLDLPDGRFFMPLFVALAGDHHLDADLDQRIRDRLRREYTPRHVPDRIIQVPLIPMTRTGKKMEIPVRRILLGAPPEQAANTTTMAAPDALDAFVAYAREQQDYEVG